MICSDFYRCFECFRAFVVRLVRSDLHNNTNLNFSKHCFNNKKRMFIVSIVYNKFYMLFIISKIIIIIIIRMFLISRISKIRRKSRIPYLILCNSIFLNKKYTEESNPRCLIQFLIKLKLFINSINRLNWYFYISIFLSRILESNFQWFLVITIMATNNFEKTRYVESPTAHRYIENTRKTRNQGTSRKRGHSANEESIFRNWPSINYIAVV